ncbi:hypothetical protein ACEWX3_07645 [Mycobacterium sp. G7A2]|uniref:hypothetical protein n=1 Tax=Mycobacterium sp. G7A2 TaxID=3317307 RepID=UPI0035A93AED
MFKRHPAISRKVMVSLYSGTGISGVLVQKVGQCLVLKGATVHEPGTDPQPADGEIVIDTANVDYLQAF